MKFIKPVVAAFLLFFSLLGLFGLISFDVVIPVTVICTALITLADAKHMARENRINDARSLMNCVVFMIALVMFWFFSKL